MKFLLLEFRNIFLYSIYTQSHCYILDTKFWQLNVRYMHISAEARVINMCFKQFTGNLKMTMSGWNM